MENIGLLQNKIIMIIKKSEDCVDRNPHWIAGSEIAAIRKVKNQIFSNAVSPL